MVRTDAVLSRSHFIPPAATNCIKHHFLDARVLPLRSTAWAVALRDVRFHRHSHFNGCWRVGIGDRSHLQCHQWLCGRTVADGAVSRSRHIRIWLRRWHLTADECGHETVFHPRRHRDLGSHRLRSQSRAALLRRRLLSLRRPESSPAVLEDRGFFARHRDWVPASFDAYF